MGTEAVGGSSEGATEWVVPQRETNEGPLRPNEPGIRPPKRKTLGVVSSREQIDASKPVYSVSTGGPKESVYVVPTVREPRESGHVVSSAPSDEAGEN